MKALLNLTAVKSAFVYVSTHSVFYGGVLRDKPEEHFKHFKAPLNLISIESAFELYIS